MCVWFEPRGEGSIQVYFFHLITHQIQTVDDFQVPPGTQNALSHWNIDGYMFVWDFTEQSLIYYKVSFDNHNYVWLSIISLTSRLYHCKSGLYEKLLFYRSRFWMNPCYFLNNRHPWLTNVIHVHTWMQVFRLSESIDLSP